MQKLVVPKLSLAHHDTSVEKTVHLLQSGVKADINQVNWKEDFPKSMPVAVTLAHDGEHIYLYFEVKGEQVRAANTKDMGSVWEDSCVEFFMQREGDTGYRNFECNILGVLLGSNHASREESERLSDDLLQQIVRVGTTQQRFDNGLQVCDWTMYLEIPKAAMGFAADESLEGQLLRANFYKCGDETPEPHFISWNPIDMPQPNFHVPQFFGTLELE